MLGFLTDGQAVREIDADDEYSESEEVSGGDDGAPAQCYPILHLLSPHRTD
jgi:hypothetical protein